MLRNRAKRKYGTVAQEIQFSEFYRTAIVSYRILKLLCDDLEVGAVGMGKPSAFHIRFRQALELLEKVLELLEKVLDLYEKVLEL